MVLTRNIVQAIVKPGEEASVADEAKTEADGVAVAAGDCEVGEMGRPRAPTDETDAGLHIHVDMGHVTVIDETS